MAEDRSQADEEFQAGAPIPFERFERLAKRLFAVPKIEIDEQRATDERGPIIGNGVGPNTTAH